MSYEFIIGTLIGIAGLALTWICSKEQIKSYFKPNMQDLFNQLASANISRNIALLEQLMGEKSVMYSEETFPIPQSAIL